MTQTFPKVKQMPNLMSIKVCDELYALIAKEADAKGVAMTDIIASALAEHYGKPELGYVPRKPQGRKRYKQPAA